jgi:hypothetical protein
MPPLSRISRMGWDLTRNLTPVKFLLSGNNLTAKFVTSVLPSENKTLNIDSPNPNAVTK